MKKSNLPKWQQKLTAAERKHVRETTNHNRRWEVKQNVTTALFMCDTCRGILRKASGDRK